MNYNIIDYKEGMEIAEPCIVRNMPNEIYHKMPALSNSGMKTLLNCPAKYYYKYLSGEYEPKEKPCFKIGKAAHCYLLEGREKFEQIYWVNPYAGLLKEDKIKILDPEGAMKLGKYKLNEIDNMLFERFEVKPKEICLSQIELKQVINMVTAIKQNQGALRALSQKGESELSLFWQDEKTGVWLKCRPDFLPYDCLDVPDYKTTDNANPVTFYNSFIRYGYHIQAAMYKKGIQTVCGAEVENFFFLVQEKEAPYVSQIFNPVTKHVVLWGEKAIERAIEKYLECKETGLWGGYCDKVIELRIEPAPDDLGSTFDKQEGVLYAPKWIDKMLVELYEV